MMSENEINKELLLILFGHRHSNTVSQKVLNRCEVCERALEDERFFDTELERLIEEQEPILTAIKSLFDQPKDGGTK